MTKRVRESEVEPNNVKQDLHLPLNGEGKFSPITVSHLSDAQRTALPLSSREGPADLARRKSYSGTRKPSRKQVFRPESKKPVHQSEPSISKKWSSDDVKSGRDFVLGQVTILKRGESLDAKKKNESLEKNGEDLIVCSTERLGPDPEMVPKFLSPVAGRSEVYAGSAFFLSPSPSSLPLPSFSKKKEGVMTIIDDSATKDLRRLLRLD
ncbi:hypothetical protein HHK36_026627 [Tetracentron sinense]|uniref:Uncharacterized protein n=1 Tax=Tetracentron sinense TaxID=13715 RepID=A0A835D2T7_TETSI|nr:hypothetical protein HHK36_026627 [Tetracentron sinense]